MWGGRCCWVRSGMRPGRRLTMPLGGSVVRVWKGVCVPAGRMGPLLVGTAAALRAGRRAADEEAAERLAVRLVVPLGLCHLPAFVVLGIAPVVASVGLDLVHG